MFIYSISLRYKNLSFCILAFDVTRIFFISMAFSISWNDHSLNNSRPYGVTHISPLTNSSLYKSYCDIDKATKNIGSRITFFRSSRKYFKDIKELKEVTNYLPLSIAVLGKDFKFKFVNKRFENLLGYRLCELQGQDIANVIQRIPTVSLKHCTTEPPMPPDDIYEFLCSEGKAVVCVVNRCMERIIFIAKSHILNNKNILLLFEENGVQSQPKSSMLPMNPSLDSINTFIILVDKNNKVVSCNKLFYELTKIRPGNAVGIPLKHICKLLNLKFINTKFIKKQCISKYSKTREVVIDTINDEKKHVIIRVSPIEDENNKNNCYIITGSDITYLNKDQVNEHQEKLAIIGQLGSGIVHEAKNMLASIKGYCQLISLRTDNDYVRKHVKRVESITTDLNRIIIEFLDLSKPTPNILSTILLNDIVLSIEYLLESPSFIRGVKLEINLTEHDKPICANQFQIKQVILNIAKNAIEAMEGISNPLLKISTSFSNPDNKMILTISDNGKGLHKSELSKLYKPFYTTKDYGTGLGLITCRRIIEEHNGKIQIESEVGKGTSFFISIPCK